MMSAAARARKPNPLFTGQERIACRLECGGNGSMTRPESISVASRLRNPNSSFAEQEARRDDLRGGVEYGASVEETVR